MGVLLVLGVGMLLVLGGGYLVYKELDSMPTAAPAQPVVPVTAASEPAQAVGLPTPSWVFCLEAQASKSKAQDRAEYYRRKGVTGAGVLWIPDYASLSEANMYLVHGGTHAYSDRSGAKAKLKKLKRIRKKAYALKLSKTGPRQSLE
jgi:hypothetical protein